MRSPSVSVIVCVAVSLVCLVSGQTIRRENPCDRRSGHSAHEEYCDRYYDCVGENEVLERSCPNGLVYAGRKSLIDVCGYVHEYPCGERSARNTAQPTEHCDWLYGIFGHETSCTRYWTCWNGTASEQYCIGGLLFNEATHSCDWPEFVKDCQKHPLCTEDPNGNVPLGNSCERYWSCQGGYPRLMRCPATLVFDKRSRRCVHPPTDDCDIPVTEAPEELEEQETQQDRRRGQGQGNQQRRQQVADGRRPQQQQQQLQQNDQQQFLEQFEPVGTRAEQAAAASSQQFEAVRPLQPVRRRKQPEEAGFN